MNCEVFFQYVIITIAKYVTSIYTHVQILSECNARENAGTLVLPYAMESGMWIGAPSPSPCSWLCYGVLYLISGWKHVWFVTNFEILRFRCVTMYVYV